MRWGHHRTNFSLVAFSEGGFSAGSFAVEEKPSELAISGLSAEILASLPGDARHEYLAAYRRARSLAKAAAMPVIEKGRRERAGASLASERPRAEAALG